MELVLKRTWLTGLTTISTLTIDGRFECFVLEDRFRPPPQAKVPKKTAIPNGRYRVQITHSQRFNRDLPLLIDVPGFQGIRIHPGNTAEDTEGCLLPGRTQEADRVGESRLAFEALFAKLRAAIEPIFITITL